MDNYTKALKTFNQEQAKQANQPAQFHPKFLGTAPTTSSLFNELARHINHALLICNSSELASIRNRIVGVQNRIERDTKVLEQLIEYIG